MKVIYIDETGRNNLKDKPSLFNSEKLYCKDLVEVKDKLIDRYGKMPKGRNKVYRDKKNGSSVVVGFTYSFWNKDISHGGKSWYQTDWIEIRDRQETPELL